MNQGVARKCDAEI